MAVTHAPVETASVMDTLHAALISFPIACFTLTVLTDMAYWGTENLLWLHFSEWLLLAGLVFGTLALLLRAADLLVRRVRPAWPAVIGGIAVLLLAIVNSFVHTVDGWPAVVPKGLIVSILTFAAMLITAWFARRRVRHV